MSFRSEMPRLPLAAADGSYTAGIPWLRTLAYALGVVAVAMLLLALLA